MILVLLNFQYIYHSLKSAVRGRRGEPQYVNTIHYPQSLFSSFLQSIIYQHTYTHAQNGSIPCPPTWYYSQATVNLSQNMVFREVPGPLTRLIHFIGCFLRSKEKFMGLK